VVLSFFSDLALYIILPGAEKPEKRGFCSGNPKCEIIYLKAYRLKNYLRVTMFPCLKAIYIFLTPE
jgi:hypothetical protein